MDAWKESGGNDRHTSEPTTTADESPELEDALREAFADVLDGDAPSNSTIRDENLAALLRGLEEAGELGRVVREANDKLGRESDGESRNDALKALVRLGLAQVRPDVMGLATDARNDVERVNDF